MLLRADMVVSAAAAAAITQSTQPQPNTPQETPHTHEIAVGGRSMKAAAIYKGAFLPPTRKIPGCKFRLTISYAGTKIASEANVATVRITEPGIAMQTMKRSRRIGKGQRLSTKRMLLSRTGGLQPKKNHQQHANKSSSSSTISTCSASSSNRSSPEPVPPLPNEVEAMTILEGWNHKSSIIVRKETPVRVCFDLDDVQVTKAGKYQVPMQMFDVHDPATFYMSAREILDATKDAQDLGFYEVDMYCRVEFDKRKRCKMVQVKWTTGEMSWEPMKQLLKDDPVGLKRWLENQEQTIRDRKQGNKRRNSHNAAARPARVGNKAKLLVGQDLAQARELLNNEVGRRPCKQGRNSDPDKWLARYSELKVFMDENGHCLIPKSLKPQLFNWVNNQRSSLKNGKMDRNIERRQLLDDIGFWWSVQRTPKPQACDVKKKRCKSTPSPAKKKKRRLSNADAKDKVRCLVAKENNLTVASKNSFDNDVSESVRGCGVWDERWREMLSKLTDFRDENGEGWTRKLPKCPKLRRWIYTQRTQYQALCQGEPSFMTDRRIQLLNQVGFAWVGTRGRPKKMSGAIRTQTPRGEYTTSKPKGVLDQHQIPHQVPSVNQEEEIKDTVFEVVINSHKTPQQETRVSTDPPVLVQREAEQEETTSEESSSASSVVAAGLPKIQVLTRGFLVSDDDGTPRKRKLLELFEDEGEMDENTNIHDLPKLQNIDKVDLADLDSVSLIGFDERKIADVVTEITDNTIVAPA